MNAIVKKRAGKIVMAALMAVSASVVQGGGGYSISVVECAKCQKRMRILDDGKSANINLCRLKDDSPDAATLEKRVQEMKERAAAYLKRGEIRATGDPRCPLMGWSSWNTFALNISEGIILDTARAMATNGLKEAGYLYVNIDDGFFTTHDEAGNLRFHPRRFPNGMKGTVDGIHALGLKAGIYSDAGADTCGSMYGGDADGRGAGLYGHDAADCRLHFNELGFDFIKVDYCGGRALGLDERKRYTEISDAIRATGRCDVRLNICRWAFPGTWAADIAESWRTTGDINSSWKSIKGIIDENLYLSAYASPGHFNDMDMLETGRLWGEFKDDAETTHFGMWCMMSSPLLVGCDVRNLPSSVLGLLTNPYLIGMNQNRGLGVQGYVAQRPAKDAYVLVKDADERFGRSRYVALYNGGEKEMEFTVSTRALDLGGEVRMFDLVERADTGSFRDETRVLVFPHASKFYLFDADERLERSVYEAETAYLSEYQELRDAAAAGTAFPAQVEGASGGVAVKYLGNRGTNDLVWKDVCIMKGGERTLRFRCQTFGERRFFVQVDGGDGIEVCVPQPQGGGFAMVETKVVLNSGMHEIRISNPGGWCPDIDCMTLD